MSSLVLLLLVVMGEGLTPPGFRLLACGASRCSESKLRRRESKKCSRSLRVVPFDDEESSSVVSSAALIAGTTIGGGFLALPSATAPLGAAPSVLGLSVVWLFLLGTSFSMVDSIFMLNKNMAASDSTVRNLSIFSLVKECFGDAAGTLAGMVFLLLVNVTLVAQLSKIGTILNAAFPLLGRGVWTLVFSAMAVLLCTLEANQIDKTNDALTTTMVLSFVMLVICACSCGWSAERLIRADFNSLLPFGGGIWAVPIFIQLLIYNEVVPLVSSRLCDKRRVKQAIALGSLVPLLMCIIWSCVALGIVPYDPASVLTGAVVYDPVQSLKKLLSNLPVGNAFLALVNILAASAICTTVIGSMLASTQYFRDFKFRGNNSGSVAPKSELMHGKAGEVLLNSLAIIPSACVAYCGSSDLYFLASQFAGEFPCTFLYGLLPSLCNLKLRLHDGSIKSAKGKVAIEWLLVAISMSILMVSCFS